MRFTIGIVLTLIGGTIAVVGLLGALSELVSLYSSALNDPLAADAPEGKAVGASMIRWVIIGAAGVPLLLVGSVLLKISLFQKVRKMARGSSSSGQRPVAAVSQWDVPRNREGRSAQAPAQTEQKSRDGVPRREELGESGGNKRER